LTLAASISRKGSVNVGILYILSESVHLLLIIP
jgi:hypothetical protein